MNGLSLKTKTFFLSGIIISLLLVVGGVGIYAVDHLSLSITSVSGKSLPAVRYMTLVDMMHDGVRAVVYRSFVSKPEENAEIEAEFKEFSGNITNYLNELKKLGLDEETITEINDADKTIKTFQQDAEMVINLALQGDKVNAEAHLPAFMKSFDHLAEDLEKIGSKTLDKANADAKKSQDDATWLSKLALYIVGFGVVVSALVSFAAYSFISGLTNGLLNITKGLKNETEEIVTTSQSMAEVATRLSEAATEQAASLQETVASVDEISAMVSRNAESAGTSARVSDQSKINAEKGKERTQVMMGSINAIATGNEEIIKQMHKSNSEISEIVKVIQNISLKTQVINDIVFQTKLLSFNASVEAARAGEHGKGFAVVAEEVGNLASMSGKAATEITEMLSGSVQKVTDIVDNTKRLMENLIRESKDKVEFGTKTAKECTQALEEILNNVSSVNEMVREISNASNEQSIGIGEVNKAMSELDKVTQSNSGIAQESAKAATGLEDQASRLNDLVSELTKIVGGKSDDGEHHHSKVSTFKKSQDKFQKAA